MVKHQVQFGSILKHLRNQKKLTQEAFAELIGVTASAVAHYESGESYPAYTTLCEIIKVLEVDANLLFEHETAAPPSSVAEVVKQIYAMGKEQKEVLNEFLRMIAILINGCAGDNSETGRDSHEDSHM